MQLDLRLPPNRKGKTQGLPCPGPPWEMSLGLTYVYVGLNDDIIHVFRYSWTILFCSCWLATGGARAPFANCFIAHIPQLGFSLTWKQSRCLRLHRWLDGGFLVWLPPNHQQLTSCTSVKSPNRKSLRKLSFNALVIFYLCFGIFFFSHG